MKEQKLFKSILLDIKSQYLPCNTLGNCLSARLPTLSVSHTLVQETTGAGKGKKTCRKPHSASAPQEARAEPGLVPNGAKPLIQREGEADEESIFRASTSRPGTRVVNHNSGSHGT